MSGEPILMSDEEFEALERALQTRAPPEDEVTREQLHEDLFRLALFARYWRDRAAEDPNLLREMQSTEVG